MPRKVMLSIFIAIVLAVPLVMAQNDNLLKHVYLVRIKTLTKTYIQTGFRKTGTKGIITALHGAAFASSLSARNKENDVLVNLKIVSVDFANDIALLSNNELDKRRADGLQPLAKLDIKIGDKLRVLGHPYGIELHIQTLKVGTPGTKKLIDLLPSGSREILSERGSPNPQKDVINIEGSLVAGHSGAPIVDENDILIGVGNGGLAGGAANISWAIPINKISWQPVSRKQIEELAKSKVNELFDLQEVQPEPQKSVCGVISLNNYLKEQKGLSVGLGFGYRNGDQVIFGNIPTDISIGSPHPDDWNQPILDPTNPDNYTIIREKIFVDLANRLGVNVNVSFYGLLNFAVSISQAGESGENGDRNFFDKIYIPPSNPITHEGEAKFYYTIRTKNRGFSFGNSFSLPIYLTYPIFYCGKNSELNRRIIFRAIGGTTIYFSHKIELEAEKGWDRFNRLEVDNIIDLGNVKKKPELFVGFDIKATPTQSLQLGLQITFINTRYEFIEEQNLLSLELRNNWSTSFRLNMNKSF